MTEVADAEGLEAAVAAIGVVAVASEAAVVAAIGAVAAVVVAHPVEAVVVAAAVAEAASALVPRFSWSPTPASLESTFREERMMFFLPGTQPSERACTTRRESQLR